jgi:hypothetical protein
MELMLELTVTTQGPLYPPSEIMDKNGNFVVVGNINEVQHNKLLTQWGAAIVSPHSQVPKFGQQAPYKIVRLLNEHDLGKDADLELFTLPLPLPCNNYPMLFAPEQAKNAHEIIRNSRPLNDAVPDLEAEHSRQYADPITLGSWLKAQGQLKVSLLSNGRDARFEVLMYHLVPNSLYTVMALRENDLRSESPTRPGPLGVPNCFITDEQGNGRYIATMRHPFPRNETNQNRIINIVVLFMSTQCSHGGAIGLYGLGGDIHAQLKFRTSKFEEFTTRI